MTSHVGTDKLTRSPSASHKTPQDDITGTCSPDEKYTRLEFLLRQTLSLAEEIAEKVSSQHPSHVSATGAGHAHNSGECIIIHKTFRAASEAALGLSRQSSTSCPRRKLRPSYDSEQDSTSPSAASSMQEPFSPGAFSPGSLAMSLDAIVEGKRSETPLVETSTFIMDRLPESTPLTRATTSQAPTSLQCPTPASAFGQESMSQSATSAPIPIPGPSRRRPFVSHRNSSPGLGVGEEASSPPPEWHVRIFPVQLHREPVLSSSPPRTPTLPAFVKLEAVFPYRSFSDRHAAAHWNGEGLYIIIGRSCVDGESQSPLNQEGCEHEFGPATGSSLHDFIENWEGTLDEPGEGQERTCLHDA